MSKKEKMTVLVQAVDSMDLWRGIAKMLPSLIGEHSVTELATGLRAACLKLAAQWACGTGLADLAANKKAKIVVAITIDHDAGPYEISVRSACTATVPAGTLKELRRFTDSEAIRYQLPDPNQSELPLVVTKQEDEELPEMEAGDAD